MPIRPPTETDLREFGERLHLDLREEELAELAELAADQLVDYETVASYTPTVRADGEAVRPRSAGLRVPSVENPKNAWVSRCTVEGDEEGPLAGWEVAVKDNVSVAGVEMTCGSRVLEGYVPDADATIVTRLLDAGATVVGKTNMDDMAMTTTGHSAFGPVLHPESEDHLAGGSSGGSAVVVATGEVDAAIGTDQGGSVRLPSAYCGIVGHKPTHGLIPYTGCVGLEHTIDHPGPMGPDVETVARLLTVFSGDGPEGAAADDRQPRSIPDERYHDLEGEVSELRIGVLREGFDRPDADPAVLDRVRAAIDLLASACGAMEEVSVPMHADARAIHSVCASEGLVAAMAGEGLGHGRRKWYDTTWVDAFGKFRRTAGGEFPAALKRSLLVGAYAAEKYHARYYARGMNLVLDLTEGYDALFEEVDLLAMPTTTRTAPEHDPERSEFDRLRDGREAANTAAFNRTGHPAISVPAGAVDGLPVGLMLVGPEFEDARVLEAGYALQRIRSDG
ncbi:amidase family protein [Natronorarus salvus]|uniref:amidase family protein n=1 Tax=Natronorarus salvus TaxID=3117733 RepID=UPI002F25F0B0